MGDGNRKLAQGGEAVGPRKHFVDALIRSSLSGPIRILSLKALSTSLSSFTLWISICSLADARPLASSRCIRHSPSLSFMSWPFFNQSPWRKRSKRIIAPAVGRVADAIREKLDSRVSPAPAAHGAVRDPDTGADKNAGALAGRQRLFDGQRYR